MEPDLELILEDARSISEGLWRMARLAQEAAESLDERIEDLAATVAATGATLDGIRRTIIAVQTLEFALFAGHTGLLRYVADVS